MDINEQKEIYERIKNNSIGDEKRCAYKKIIKKGNFLVAVTTLIGTFMISTLTGCGYKNGRNSYDDVLNKQSEHITSSVEKSDKYNGFEIYDIYSYESLRTAELFVNNGFTDYSMKEMRRDYHYIAEDYKKLSELDETYLYSIYTNSTEETFLEVLKALGYSDLETFLLKNNYVDKNGDPSTLVWSNQNLIQMSEIMKQEEKQR